MSQQLQQDKANQEGRIELALQAYKDGQFKSLRRAANAYNVPQPTIYRRYNGTLARANCQPNCQKLTATEVSSPVSVHILRVPLIANLLKPPATLHVSAYRKMHYNF